MASDNFIIHADRVATAAGQSDTIDARTQSLVARPSTLRSPHNLPAPDPLVVRCLTGDTKRLVVSLSGVGRDPHTAPPMEFLATASDNGRNHALFISDLSRCWMQNKSLVDYILRLISNYKAAHQIETVVLLGNSMGAFAALILPDLIEVQTVIAFAPQYSANPAIVPEEERWGRFRGRIRDWAFPDVGNLAQKRTNYFIFHGDHPAEVIHWKRFPAGRNISHFIIKGADHNVAKKLRRRGLVLPLCHAAMEGKSRQVRRTLERSLTGGQLKVFRREQYEACHPQFGSVRP